MNKKQIESLIPVARNLSFSFLQEVNFKHISIILSGKSIAAIGMNNGKTHTMTRELNYYDDRVHSELDAYSKIRYRNGSFVLVNFRFNRTGELRNSKPCNICLPWCVTIFDEIWYSTDEGMVKL